MKAEKRARLIREAVEASRRAAEMRRPATFATVDLKTGLPSGEPAVISFPVDTERLLMTSRFVVDLASIGYRLTPL